MSVRTHQLGIDEAGSSKQSDEKKMPPVKLIDLPKMSDLRRELKNN